METITNDIYIYGYSMLYSCCAMIKVWSINRINLFEDPRKADYLYFSEEKPLYDIEGIHNFQFRQSRNKLLYVSFHSCLSP